MIDVHPEAELVGMDERAEMLAAVSEDVAASREPSPEQLLEGNFDIVVALAVHHLDGETRICSLASPTGSVQVDGSCSATSLYRIRSTSSHQSTACTTGRAP